MASAVEGPGCAGVGCHDGDGCAASDVSAVAVLQTSRGCGCLPDDRADRGFRGRAPLRNSAAAEPAVTTGMRLRCLPRDVQVQDATLRELDLYRRTERAAVVKGSARTLRRHRAELFVVDDVDTRQMRLGGILHGRRRSFRIAEMDAGLRRIMVIEGERGLESMALFVGRGGRMPSKQRWEQLAGGGAAQEWSVRLLR